MFLHGGNDGLNSFPPIDGAGYNRYAAVRRDVALPQGSILPLNASQGLHPGLAALKPVWDEQKMALVHNVGPLARPLTRVPSGGTTGSSMTAWNSMSRHTSRPAATR